MSGPTKAWHALHSDDPRRQSLAAALESRRLIGPLDLRGISIGGIEGLEWTKGYDLSHSEILDVDLSRSRLSCAMVASKVARTRFAGTRFSNVHFIGSVFQSCIFDESSFFTPLMNNAVFEGCSFVSCTFLGKGGAIPPDSGVNVKFTGCDFTDAKMKQLYLRGVKFLSCKLGGLEVRKSIIFNWRFFENTIRQTAFSECIYRGLNVGIE